MKQAWKELCENDNAWCRDVLYGGDLFRDVQRSLRQLEPGEN